VVTDFAPSVRRGAPVDGVVDDLDSAELVEGVGQTPGHVFEEAGLMSVQTSSIASGSPRYAVRSSANGRWCWHRGLSSEQHPRLIEIERQDRQGDQLLRSRGQRAAAWDFSMQKRAKSAAISD
jgi:hypothetical protein